MPMPSIFGPSGKRGVWLFTATLLLIGEQALAQSTSGCSSACTTNGGRCIQELNSNTYYCDCNGNGGVQPDCARPASNATSPTSNSTSSTSSSGSSQCPVACVNGRCSQQLNSAEYYCACNSGFSGPSCATGAPAASPPAASNSTTSSSGTYTCPVACANGRCSQQDNSDQYFCQCNSGYSGVACDVATSNAPTASNSTSATAGTFSCPVACRNGQCLQEINSDSYYCSCSTGYSGTDCSVATSPARAPTTATTSGNATCNITCKNRGTCRPVQNSREFYCECPSGYTDWDCGKATGSTASGVTSSAGAEQHGARTLEGWKIFVIVLAAVVGAILAASVAYIIYRQRRKPATFVKFTDGDAEGQQEIEIRRTSTSV